ncbi:MAG: CPBP family intramembrane metalloprotease [Pseudomonadota bacterium]|nr:CPBP family intramembrane metalloprotease [Pseudomonadota bacterium]
MIRMLLQSAVLAGTVLMLALPALRSNQRGWIVGAAVLAFLYSVAIFVPIAYPHLVPVLGKNWNWTGKLVSIATTAVMMVLLLAYGGFRARDLGLTFGQAPDTGRAILFGIVPFLILVGCLAWQMSPHSPWPDQETLAYQASLPGLDEEFFFRGVLLAIFDRMFPAKRTVLGARMGYGALAISITFGVGHAVLLDKALHPHFYVVEGLFAGITGLMLVWIRARTQSLVLPVLTHNAVNLINYIVPAVF